MKLIQLTGESGPVYINPDRVCSVYAHPDPATKVTVIAFGPTVEDVMEPLEAVVAKLEGTWREPPSKHVGVEYDPFADDPTKPWLGTRSNTEAEYFATEEEAAIYVGHIIGMPYDPTEPPEARGVCVHGKQQHEECADCAQEPIGTGGLI